jgi:hypothetical protein
MKSPLRPRDLFTSVSDGATPQINAWGGRGPLVSGYFWAAGHLCDSLTAQGGPVDTAVYPAVFLVRHGLELAFKELVDGFDIELRRPRGKGAGHRLDQLWNTLAPDLTQWMDLRRYTSERSDTVIEVSSAMSEIVAVLHEVDPTGEHARYDVTLPKTVNGQKLAAGVTLARYPNINLRVLGEMAHKLQVWSEDLIPDRREELEFIHDERVRKGTLDAPPDP